MKKVLVTGGGGFLGSAIVTRLLARGCQVSVAGRHRYPALERLGARCLVGDIGAADFARRICSGVDTVFHVAARAGIWGDWNEYRRVNLDGTVHLVEGCRKHQVGCLVYTSTPSVVFDRQSIENGDEALPYAERFLCGYAWSKAAAERHVLERASDDLRVCVLRPHLIWGPGDPHLLPRLIERGRQGRLKIVGNGRNLVDITHVDNAAHAHILAAEALHRTGTISGQAYFIGQEKPVMLWAWINDLYRKLGITEIKKRVPLTAAYLVGWLLESLHRMAGVKKEPPMTRFLALQLGRSHYFSHDKARRDFGYEPQFTIEEGMARLLDPHVR